MCGRDEAIEMLLAAAEALRKHDDQPRPPGQRHVPAHLRPNGPIPEIPPQTLLGGKPV